MRASRPLTDDPEQRTSPTGSVQDVLSALPVLASSGFRRFRSSSPHWNFPRIVQVGLNPVYAVHASAATGAQVFADLFTVNPRRSWRGFAVSGTGLAVQAYPTPWKLAPMTLGRQFQPVDKPYTGGVGMKKGGAPGQGTYRNLGPAALGEGDARPERAAPGGRVRQGQQQTHRGIIEGALAQHPKKISFQMFTEGLAHMGVRSDKNTLKHLAGEALTNPERFSELIGRARGHYFNGRDQAKAAQRRARAAGGGRQAGQPRPQPL